MLILKLLKNWMISIITTKGVFYLQQNEFTKAQLWVHELGKSNWIALELS